jgi:hypothetical protein
MLLMLMPGLQDLMVLAARQITVEGLACFTALQQLPSVLTSTPAPNMLLPLLLLLLLLLPGLQDLMLLSARQLTVEGLACLTALKQLTGLCVLGSQLCFSNRSSSGRGDSDNSDDESGRDSAGRQYKNIALYQDKVRM